MSSATGLSKFDANPEEWITASEAARIRGVTRQAIANLMRRGRLRTLVFGQKTFVNRRDVMTFTPDLGGRPKKENAEGNLRSKKKGGSRDKRAK